MICTTMPIASASYRGRDGFIYVFHMTDPDHYELYTKVATALSKRTAGYFGKGSNGQTRFCLTFRAQGPGDFGTVHTMACRTRKRSGSR